MSLTVTGTPSSGARSPARRRASARSASRSTAASSRAATALRWATSSRRRQVVNGQLARRRSRRRRDVRATRRRWAPWRLLGSATRAGIALRQQASVSIAVRSANRRDHGSVSETSSSEASNGACCNRAPFRPRSPAPSRPHRPVPTAGATHTEGMTCRIDLAVARTALALVIGASLTLAACGSGSDSGSSGGGGGKGDFTVGISNAQGAQPILKLTQESFTAAAKRDGIKVKALDAQLDPAKQVTDVDQLVAQQRRPDRGLPARRQLAQARAQPRQGGRHQGRGLGRHGLARRRSGRADVERRHRRKLSRLEAAGRLRQGPSWAARARCSASVWASRCPRSRRCSSQYEKNVTDGTDITVARSCRQPDRRHRRWAEGRRDGADEVPERRAGDHGLQRLVGHRCRRRREGGGSRRTS